ncbi:hypothetical protein ACET3Z_031396 [Daucus carota]
MMMTMADFSDQLFGFEDALFDNSNGRLEFSGNNFTTLWPCDVNPGLWLNSISRMGAIYSLLVREEGIFTEERKRGSDNAKDVSDKLYTLNRMIGSMDELLDWDMGLGVDHPDYMDLLIPDGVQEPMNFDVALGIADQVNGLVLGQETVQDQMAQTVNAMQNGANNIQLTGNEGVQASVQFMAAANGEEAVVKQKETHQTCLVENGLFFGGDPSIEDIDYIPRPDSPMFWDLALVVVICFNRML